MKSLWLAQNELRNTYVQQNCKDNMDHPHVLTIDKLQQQQHSPTKKMKRFRSAFTTDQVHYLEKQFKKFPYIGNTHRREVAIALNIPERAVKIWFQNRRMKEKKETTTKECDEEQSKRKSTAISKEQLHNVAARSVDDRSIPNNLVKEIKIHVVENNNSVDQSQYIVKLDKVNKNTAHMSSPSTGFQDNQCNAASDLSINLCRKYKSEPNNNNKTAEETVKPQALVEQSFPLDLSFSKTQSVPTKPEDTHAPVAKSIPNILNAPEFVSVPPSMSPIYAQPYFTPGGVVWKPINLLSVVPSSLPVLPSSPVQFTANSAEKSDKCCCNCHTKSQTSVTLQQNPANSQYIITAVPYQNPSTKF